PLPGGVPLAVLAAHDGRDGRFTRRWLERQQGLADALGARFEAVGPSGHLMMLDRPDAVARAVRAARAVGGES
ncbi:MAG TPA: alpha/beta hydrolase, partial [Streptomyces sp.]|nr:alpha/beta hydrolase [Streptomyces sp.]